MRFIVAEDFKDIVAMISCLLRAIGFVRWFHFQLSLDGDDDNGDDVNDGNCQEEGLATSRSLRASYLIYPSFSLILANMNQSCTKCVTNFNASEHLHKIQT